MGTSEIATRAFNESNHEPYSERSTDQAAACQQFQVFVMSCQRSELRLI